MINELTTYITAISAVIGAITAIYKLFKKIDNIQDSFKDNMLITLKLAIINEKLPIDERISCGEQYIALGGNGSVKQIVKQLAQEEAHHLISDHHIEQ